MHSSDLYVVYFHPNIEFLGMDPRLLQPPVNGSGTRRRGDDCQQEQPHLHRVVAAFLKDADRRHDKGCRRGEPQCASTQHCAAGLQERPSQAGGEAEKHFFYLPQKT